MKNLVGQILLPLSFEKLSTVSPHCDTGRSPVKKSAIREFQDARPVRRRYDYPHGRGDE